MKPDSVQFTKNIYKMKPEKFVRNEQNMKHGPLAHYFIFYILEDFENASPYFYFFLAISQILM